MARRFSAILLAVALAAAVAPTLAHTVSFTTRETGTSECSWNQDVRTDIVAVGHHRHTRVGYESVIYHTGIDRYYGTYAIWNTFAMNWALANQYGYPYDYTSSGGGCTG